MLGIETEYGLAVTGPRGSGLDRGRCVRNLMTVAMQRFCFLPASGGNGVFLGNGSRFYIDSGGHPEMCTPEVDNPWDVVRYVGAGEAMLQELASAVAMGGSGAEVVLFKCNVDYSGSGATWACHENYGHRLWPDALPGQIIPHLVSRLIYTGAGGLNPFSPGFEFCLSPRVYHLERDISPSSTGGRAIYHIKDESLSDGGWHRLHVLCGESLCSHLGTWLKVGGTGLVVALAEAGLQPGEGVQLRSPLEAMRCFNADPTGQATAELTDGRRVSALEIQRHYQQFARRHLAHPSLPRWAAPLCAAWGEILDRLEGGPSQVTTRLDWAIKQELYRNHARSRGFAPARAAAWNQALRQLLSRYRLEGLLQLATIDRPEGRAPALPLGWEALAPELEQAGLDWRELPAFLRLRGELCELEVRFGRLGPESVFAALEQAGVLEHRLPEVSPASVQEAVRQPPASGRAHYRGRVIQERSGQGGYGCDWAGISSPDGSALNLANPFPPGLPAWTQPAVQAGGGAGHVPVNPLELAKQAFDRGLYDRAFAHLTGFAATGASAQADDRFMELMVWVQCRRGYFAEALRLLAQRVGSDPNTFSAAHEYVAAHRFQGLAPGEGIWPWIHKVEDLAGSGPAPDPMALFAFRGHKGCALRCGGKWVEAKAELQPALEDRDRSVLNARLFARTTADLAETHRLLGEPEQAARYLDDAENLQTMGQFLGELADFTLLNRVKLEGPSARARLVLGRAEEIQRSARNRLGLARTWLLETRLFPETSQARGRHRLLGQLAVEAPSLQSCWLFQKIMGRWEEWSNGDNPPDERDRFWGL